MLPLLPEVVEAIVGSGGSGMAGGGEGREVADELLRTEFREPLRSSEPSWALPFLS